METNKPKENNSIQEETTPRDRIRKRVIHLERENYAKKPDGLKDKEMVERIKKIIEQEVGK